MKFLRINNALFINQEHITNIFKYDKDKRWYVEVLDCPESCIVAEDCECNLRDFMSENGIGIDINQKL